ncbi:MULTISPECIES: ABC transporter ATP-binding protein [Clostridium]|jgi:ATP-binding cassette subfamily B protein|uniref:ABC transporter ATP-binding protein n=1 Tax=Clostridium butyricum TaxID=1492 RepID=A0A512TNB8_CLOBU|nr:MULTISPECIES: ABC transporter ATP-binding protein [Clostridium]ETI87642.1 MAG: ABC transporter, ATP-binding/permease protein [Clostridium butyricum DORA_1]MBS5983301.1 ABC transporter ATP-binding protein [Clostridium butyricum]MDB2152044.1 ABC transporter ATP-binding protein [Clostridium butyricum]MDK2829017.1 ATP-binding cassette, subfamily multidrug efflux pump [Clostridium butyricum]MDU1507790.1 ABC transporter ATP-binding protein [Clostridium butyricum]
MSSIKWVFTYVNKYKFRFYSAFVAALICSLMSMINPYLSGVIVDDVIMKNKSGILIYILGIMVFITVLKSVIRYTYQMVFEHVSQNVIFEIRQQMYEKLQELDVDYYNRTRTGDIMARMTGDMDAIRHFIAWVMYNIFENVTMFVFAIGTMFVINAQFTIFMFLLTPLVAYCAYRMTVKCNPIFYDIRERFSKLNTVVQENISGNRVVKAFAKERYEISKFEERNKEYMDSNMDLAKVIQKYMPMLNALSNMFSVIMILVGGILIINEKLTMGELVIFNGLIWAINNPVNMVGWLINDVQRFLAASKKMRMLLGEQTKVANPKNGIKPSKIKGEIEFRNVNFEYGDEQVLKNVNFHVRPGQRVAIFGQTGSGKSTIINLIERFYDAQSGEVLIDGVDIKKYDLHALRRNISISMQDVFLFSNTIEDNIRYGIPDIDNSKISWAAEMSDADNFINKLADSYETIVGERGVGLSGGQKQRITLARSIIKDPSILILDDTTSALDVETEAAIQKNLKSIYKGKTTFIIAHRISSIKNSDLILVLDNGEIIESGTHEELINAHGHYYDVYKEQYGEYINDGDKKREVI